MPIPTRFTDCTPEQMGDACRFEVNADGTLWTVLVFFSGNDTDDYDGRGQGETIELAMGHAILNANDEDED